MRPLSMRAPPIERPLRQLFALLLSLRLPVPGWLRGVGWRMVVGAALLGGIVHICATFAAPLLSSGHAFQQLRETLPLHSMVVLPPQATGRQSLPYLAPDTVYAMCRYDLSGGPVAVTAVVADAGWALSLHAPRGANFYVLPGQPLRRTEVSLLVVPGGPDATPPPRRESPTETHITSPEVEGLIVVRAPLRGLAWSAETEATVRQETCKQVKQ
jgi:uncharacterized membrane protein